MNTPSIILIAVPAGGWYAEYGKVLLVAALVMSAVALLLVLNRYRKGRQKKRPEPLDDTGLTKMMVQQVRDLIRQEKNEFHTTLTPPRSVNDSFRSVAPDPPVEIPEQEKIPAVPEEGPVMVELSPNSTASAVAQVARQVQRLYAKFPADEHRFSSEMLVAAQDGEQVYEIDILGDTGTYRVSESAAVQRYALSEDKYLLACAYEEIPTNRNVRIVNEGTGRLSRSGGDWHIDQKVPVKFA
ncbi:MAG: hypothetical protein V4592_08105 [Bacteroidota bacterium]